MTRHIEDVLVWWTNVLIHLVVFGFPLIWCTRVDTQTVQQYCNRKRHKMDVSQVMRMT